jgi:hypothetical protein
MPISRDEVIDGDSFQSQENKKTKPQKILRTALAAIQLTVRTSTDGNDDLLRDTQLDRKTPRPEPIVRFSPYILWWFSFYHFRRIFGQPAISY